MEIKDYLRTCMMVQNVLV